MALVFSLSLAQQLQSKFIESRTVYEVRERPSRMFTWSAFLVSQILIEIPWNTLASTLLFFCWYWTSGFDSSRAGFSFLFFCIIYPLYVTTFGQAVAAISPTAVIGTTLLSALFSFVVILYVLLALGVVCLGRTDEWMWRLTVLVFYNGTLNWGGGNGCTTPLLLRTSSRVSWVKASLYISVPDDTLTSYRSHRQPTSHLYDY